MSLYDILYDVAPHNGHVRRAVVARWGSGGEYRDRVDLDSANGRRQYFNRLAGEINVDPSGLQTSEDHRLLAAADDADAAADEIAAVTAIGDKPKTSLATELVALADDVTLWHTGAGEGYATVRVADHRETVRLRSRAFRTWLARRCHERLQRAAGAQALQDATNVLEGRAIYDGPEHIAHVRLAEHLGRIYLDLCDSQWHVVTITSDGWEVVSEAPAQFRRTKAMLTLPAPVPGATVDELRQYINVVDEDWPLVIAWLLAALRPKGPYPILCLHGEQGSAKSTSARFLRALVDPNAAALRAEPREPRDLMIAATNGWVIALDNLSSIPTWLSDALCRLSTGGGFATRTLYENDEETIFDAQRPVLVNGIEELATRGDLLDRAIVVNQPAIPEHRRRPEADLWRSFETARPRILGALLDGVATALRNVASTQPDGLPRLADFAIWVSAAESAMNWPQGRFLSAYSGNRAEANGLVLEVSPIARPLAELATCGDWSGTATELLQELEQRVGIDPKRVPKGWPSTARALSGTLNRLAPNLRAAGLYLEMSRSKRGRTVRLGPARTDADSCVTIVTSVITPTNPGSKGDAKGDANGTGDAKDRPQVP